MFTVSAQELRCTSDLDLEAVKAENLNKFELKNGSRFEEVVGEYGIFKVKEAALFDEFNILSY